MTETATVLTMAVLAAAIYCQSAPGQVPPSVAILEIETENDVAYHVDTVDLSRLATDAGPTRVPPHLAFAQYLLIGDIVKVNNTPARGT